MTTSMTTQLLTPLRQRLARRLTIAREHRGWSQRQLGMKMGLQPTTGSSRISRYEHGVCALSLDALEQLAQLLQVPYAYFFLDDEGEATRWLMQSVPGSSVRQTA